MPLTVDPHAAGRLLTAGGSPEKSAATIVLIHGRGASAAGMLQLVDEIGVPDVSAVAPQAAGATWYPHSFLAPLESNQPYLDSALQRIELVVTGLLERGVPSERVVILGFSQGACLASEFVARHPRKYGALIALTGGLIGPHGTPRHYAGRLDGVPMLLASGDPDPHVPFERVLETERVFEGMGASVDVRRYHGRAHTIGQDESDACRGLIAAVSRPTA